MSFRSGHRDRQLAHTLRFPAAVILYVLFPSVRLVLILGDGLIYREFYAGVRRLDLALLRPRMPSLRVTLLPGPGSGRQA